MKRHPVLADLSRDHHKALVTAQYIKKGAPTFRGMPVSLEGKKEYTLRFYKEHLVDHFLKEENVLFPAVQKIIPGTRALIDELIGEHQAMKMLIQKLEEDDDSENTLNDLGFLLEAHIRKEERVFFQEIQEILTDDQFHEIALHMKSR